MARNKVKVNIASKAYTIIGDDSTEHMIAVGQMVDSHVRDIASNYPALSVSDRAVLAAINISDEYIKAREKMMGMVEELTESESVLIQRLEELTSEFAVLKASVEEAERQATEAQAQKALYMEKVSKLESEISENQKHNEEIVDGKDSEPTELWLSNSDRSGEETAEDMEEDWDEAETGDITPNGFSMDATDDLSPEELAEIQPESEDEPDIDAEAEAEIMAFLATKREGDPEQFSTEEIEPEQVEDDSEIEPRDEQEPETQETEFEISAPATPELHDDEAFIDERLKEMDDWNVPEAESEEPAQPASNFWGESDEENVVDEEDMDAESDADSFDDMPEEEPAQDDPASQIGGQTHFDFWGKKEEVDDDIDYPDTSMLDMTDEDYRDDED